MTARRRSGRTGRQDLVILSIGCRSKCLLDTCVVVTGWELPLILKLAARNLFHDKLRFAATIVGIVFSIVLVTVQLGLFVSFERMVTTMIDHAPADLWIVPLGTKCFEDPRCWMKVTVIGRCRSRALRRPCRS